MSNPEVAGNAMAADDANARGVQQPEPDMEVESSPLDIEASQSDVDDELDEKLEQLKESCNEHEKMLLSGVIKPSMHPGTTRRPFFRIIADMSAPGDVRTTFEDVHVPAATVEALRTLTTLSLIRPDAFEYGVLKNNKILGVLLYGPPGTGKTHLAKALAKESGATMLEISGADVLQQYVGEGEKVVRAVFTLARKLDPCIIFFDEADAVFRARSDDEKGYHRELINQFLKEWDGITGGNSRNGFMMVATNRPYDLDEAILRRLPRRILVDVPTVDDREAILKIYLKDETLGPDVDYKALAVKTPNYTGSDLKNLCVSSAFACVYEEIRSINYDLANPSTGRPKRARLTEARHKFPKRRTLNARHFDKALDEISSTIDSGSLSKIRNFQKRKPLAERQIELPSMPSKPRLGSGAQAFKALGSAPP